MNSGARVLITVDAVGGVWQYGLDLARGLSARGAEPLLALLGPAPDEAQRANAHAIPGLRLIETGLPLDWLCDGPAPVLAAGRQIAALAGDMGADLVQLNTPALGAAPVFGVPLVAVAHGCLATWWEARNPAEPLAEDMCWHVGLMREGLRRANRVVAPSRSFARRVARVYELPELPEVIYNGRAPMEAAASSPAMSDRALTVGRLWDRAKRADLLDRVAARLDLPFDAAGHVTGPQGEHVTLGSLNLLGQLGGAVLGARLAARPVFVSAASFEPFGLAVLEAAGAGCALVLSDIDSFRELWDGAALFVGGEDAQAYAQAIRSLIDCPGLRLRMGDASRQRAASFTPLAMADGMQAIYGDLLTPGARERRAVA